MSDQKHMNFLKNMAGGLSTISCECHAEDRKVAIQWAIAKIEAQEKEIARLKLVADLNYFHLSPLEKCLRDGGPAISDSGNNTKRGVKYIIPEEMTRNMCMGVSGAPIYKFILMASFLLCPGGPVVARMGRGWHERLNHESATYICRKED